MSTDRVVLVTGGNRGIGRAIAERFVAEGYRVAVTARSGDGPEGTLTVRADVTDAAAVDAAFTEVEAKLGPVEIVVANAGITKDTLLLRMTEDDFDSVVATNLGGAFRVVKRASKGMLRARWGRVILISSVVGLYGSAGQINYAASKSALVGFARSLTRELGARGITANVVAPGFIETDMTAALTEETQAEYKKNIPAGRFATTDEVAGVVTWIASDDAAYISGAVIPVDGGLGWATELSAIHGGQDLLGQGRRLRELRPVPGVQLDDLEVLNRDQFRRPFRRRSDDAADLLGGHRPGQHRHRDAAAAFVAERERVCGNLRRDGLRGRGGARPRGVIEVGHLLLLEEVPAGERDDAVDDRELPDRSAVAGRKRVDEHDAGDPLGAGVGGAVDDVAAPAVPHQHHQSRKRVDAVDHRIDPVCDSDVSGFARRRADARERQRMDSVTGALERRGDVAP
jgi:3-oxoacyl-[acyl-carrier protein] reductase